MSAHAWWRLYIASNNGDPSYLDVIELEFRGTIGGADQASGGTPIDGAHQGSNGPQYAFDGTSTVWIGDGVPNYIGYHFASAVSVAQIAMTAIVYAPEANRAPKTFSLQYSDDGSDWTTVYTPADQINWIVNEQRVFNVPNNTLSGNITESLPITDWRITANRCSDGFGVGTGVSTGASYSIGVITTEPCLIILSPKIDYAWTASKVASVGDYVVPSNPDATPHLWKVTAVTGDAKFGTSEPAYNLSGTTISGNVTLTYISPLVDPKALGPKIPTPG